jgi:DNA-binding FrmR family transcriptional regulator
MKGYSPTVTDDLQKRLRRIEGQVRGVQRMLGEERDCREIVQQLNAIDAAVRNAAHFFLRAYARDCLLEASASEREDTAAKVEELLDLVARIR